MEGLKRKRGEIEAALAATPEAKRVRRNEAWIVVLALLGKHGGRPGLKKYMDEVGMEVEVSWGRDVDDRRPAYPEVRSWVRAVFTTQAEHCMGQHGGQCVNWEAVVVERCGGGKDRFVRVWNDAVRYVTYVDDPNSAPSETFVNVLMTKTTGRCAKFWRALTRPDFSAIDRMDVGRKMWGCWASVKAGTVGWDVAREMRVARDNPMGKAYVVEAKRQYDDAYNPGLEYDRGRGQCFMCKKIAEHRVATFTGDSAEHDRVVAVCRPCMTLFGCVRRSDEPGESFVLNLPRHLSCGSECMQCGIHQCETHGADWDEDGFTCGACVAKAAREELAEQDYEDEIEAKRVRMAEVEGTYEPGSDEDSEEEEEEEGEITPGEAAVAPMVLCQHEGCTKPATHGYPSDSEAESESDDDEGCDDDVACFVLTGSLPQPVSV